MSSKGEEQSLTSLRNSHLDGLS